MNRPGPCSFSNIFLCAALGSHLMTRSGQKSASVWSLKAHHAKFCKSFQKKINLFLCFAIYFQVKTGFINFSFFNNYSERRSQEWRTKKRRKSRCTEQKIFVRKKQAQLKEEYLCAIQFC